MTLLAAGMTGMSMAGRFSGSPAATLATEGVGEGAKMLQDRIQAVEAAMGAQSSSRRDPSRGRLDRVRRVGQSPARLGAGRRAKVSEAG